MRSARTCVRCMPANSCRARGEAVAVGACQAVAGERFAVRHRSEAMTATRQGSSVAHSDRVVTDR